ncbi:carbohydrate kinase [Streptomyces daqingensis]|uniref:Carbohydrate kinase n=1 Tax=Streptomyces daqingensis TaxID=1472640 RepID=A0ABQ2MEH4_9ACTN|nr:rhamnulokinase family protein [Streptomyces daqingensis]GGO50277.1 carbohydrate kinase [Streptomyces daqingensis]
MTGHVGPGTVELREVHRFPNRPVRTGGTLHWDVLALYQGVLDGLRAASPVDSAGVDSWAVDYGLLDAHGALLGNPVHYRDARTDGMAARVSERITPEELYAHTGLQHLPFNTLYQLAAARGTPQLAAAQQLLLIPDLLSYWLTGVRGTELTNASTTQLVDPRTRDFSPAVAEAADIELSLFPPLRQPGDPAGELLPEVLEETGLTGPVPVTAVASHDTASAVAAVPAATGRFAYIATGTWSLAGLELTSPVLSDESRQANFTNELGVDGTVRYLRNIMGLWLLQECLRTWESQGRPQDLETLLRDAAAAPPLRSVIDAGDPRFLAPGDMPRRIADACRRTGRPVPEDPAGYARCVLDSLALAHRLAVEDAQRLAAREVDAVHVVGGGVHNALLCQLTADACRLPVTAGPAEASALGNVVVQARAHGTLRGDIGDVRRVLRGALPLRTYEPSGDHGSPQEWARAAQHLRTRT